MLSTLFEVYTIGCAVIVPLIFIGYKLWVIRVPIFTLEHKIKLPNGAKMKLTRHLWWVNSSENQLDQNLIQTQYDDMKKEIDEFEAKYSFVSSDNNTDE